MVFFFDFAVTFWSGSQFINDQVTNHTKGRNYMFADVITPFLDIFLIINNIRMPLDCQLF